MRWRSKRKKAGNISSTSSKLARALAAPKAFGEEVIGSPESIRDDMLNHHTLFVLYIIDNPKLDRYYIGHTSDLEKRLAEHHAGISDFTSKATDWIVKFSRPFNSRTDAFNFEMAMIGGLIFLSQGIDFSYKRHDCYHSCAIKAPNHLNA